MTLLPLVVIVMTSFKTSDEYTTTAPFTPPRQLAELPQLRDRVHRRQDAAWASSTPPSSWSISVVGTILIGSMAAYAIDRFEFRLQDG